MFITIFTINSDCICGEQIDLSMKTANCAIGIEFYTDCMVKNLHICNSRSFAQFLIRVSEFMLREFRQVNANTARNTLHPRAQKMGQALRYSVYTYCSNDDFCSRMGRTVWLTG